MPDLATIRVSVRLAQGHLLDDFDTKTFERDYAARVIGQEPNRMEAQVRENLGSDADLVLRGRLSRVAIVANDLSLLGSYPKSGLMQVDEDTRAFFGDALQ